MSTGTYLPTNPCGFRISTTKSVTAKANRGTFPLVDGMTMQTARVCPDSPRASDGLEHIRVSS